MQLQSYWRGPGDKIGIEKGPVVTVSDATLQDPGALTYEPYFGLREKPFSLSPDPRFFFRNASHGATFDALVAGIRRREGILALTGEVGTGKTTMCRAVLQSLDRKTFAALVPDPFLSREDLLKTLLVDFGVVSVDDIRNGRLQHASRTDLSYPLYEFLTSLQPLQAFAVVMIDEAQDLPTKLLEEIRILSDLENRQKLLQLLLVGQPELQERLGTPEMRQLTQRLSVRCELPPLAREDVRPYVSHRLTVAGSNGTLKFTDAAMDLVFEASSGIPRVINLVCDRALLRAAGAATATVDAEHMLGAVDDLKLPVARSSRGSGSDKPGLDPDSFVREWREGSAARARRQLQPQPKDEIKEDFVSEAAIPQRRSRSLALVIALLVVSVATAAVAYWYWMSAASAQRADVLTSPAQPLVSGEPETLPAATVDVVSPASDESSAGAQNPASSKTGTMAATPGASADAPSPAAQGGPAASQSSAAGQPTPARFVLQMATFQNAARAEQALQELRNAGYHGYSIEVSLRDGTPAVAVFLGPYAELAPAERDLKSARQIPGYDSGLLVQVGPSALPTASRP